MNIQKTKKAYKGSIEPLAKAFDNNNKYFNDKFKKYYKYKQDIVNIVLCHSLKRLWISIYHGYSIEEDEIKIDDKPKQVNLLEQINVLDDKIKPFNLLDLRPDILNIVGDFVKRREIKELMDEEQIINGKTIEIGSFIITNTSAPLNTKEDIKDFIFWYIDLEFKEIKKYAKKRKVRLSNDDMWKCFLISFKRCKILLDINKGYYNKDVYNMDDDEENGIFEEYLKVNKFTTEI